MGSNEARIRLGIDGASGVSSTLKKVASDLTNIEISAKSISGTIKDTASSFVRLGLDAAKAATGLRSIDFKDAAQQARAYDEQLAKMSIRGGKSLDELKRKFSDFGKNAGVSGRDMANATRQFDRMNLAGLDDSAEAMRALGVYAEDTDRSLEEMIELGSALWTKLGVPASKFEAELRKIKLLANDTGLASGFLGIERALMRLIPNLAKFTGGGVSGTNLGKGLQMAAVKTGLQPAAATEAVDHILSSLISQDYPLILRAYRDYKKDPKADPLAPTDTGELGYQGVGFLRFIRDQMRTAKSTSGALYSVFGRNMKDQTAMRLFMTPGFLEGAERYSENAERMDRWIQDAESRRHLSTADQLMGRGQPVAPGRSRSRMSEEIEGQRVRDRNLEDDIRREIVGREILEQQDQVRKAMTAEQRVAAGALVSSLPPGVQDVANVGINVAASAADRPVPGTSVKDFTKEVYGGVKDGIRDGVRDWLQITPQPSRAAQEPARSAATVN